MDRPIRQLDSRQAISYPVRDLSQIILSDLYRYIPDRSGLFRDPTGSNTGAKNEIRRLVQPPFGLAGDKKKRRGSLVGS